MNINDIWDNNIPKEFWNISKYRATLGHKINHSFKEVNVMRRPLETARSHFTSFIKMPIDDP